jgi:hypothetical protein
MRASPHLYLTSTSPYLHSLPLGHPVRKWQSKAEKQSKVEKDINSSVVPLYFPLGKTFKSILQS